MQTILVDRLAQPTPRYTSYPTAPHFHPGIDSEQYCDWLLSVPAESTLSLYLHIPYCDRLCWFCGCTTKQTNRYEPVRRYLKSLHREIETIGALIGHRSTVTSVHLGGGSPTLLAPDDLVALNRALRRHFDIVDGAEISVEMDPNDLDEARYDALAAIGVTRVSLGVQDFDPKVQQAINRPQTFEQTRQVVEAMRARGVHSINLDMLYGLPHQNMETIAETCARIISLNPDRIALFGYAHVPWIKKHQKMIDESALPDIEERFRQADLAARLFTASKYQRIGMDHFARRHDTLSAAQMNGALHRNFQGYTSDDADALIGLGASSIGRLPQGYVQNSPATHDYQRRVDEMDGLATIRGLQLSDDDHMRSWLIERLMCDFGFSSSQLLTRFGVSANAILQEAEALAEADMDGLFIRDNDGFCVTEDGRPYLRTIVATFDRYLQKGAARHSVSV